MSFLLNFHCITRKRTKAEDEDYLLAPNGERDLACRGEALNNLGRLEGDSDGFNLSPDEKNDSDRQVAVFQSQAAEPSRQLSGTKWDSDHFLKADLSTS